MNYSMPRTSSSYRHSFGTRTADFNSRIEEGIRRAPEERAKAIREFWNWIRKRS